MDILQLIRADLRTFKPYQSARSDIHYDPNKIWLNANELPWNVIDNITLGESLNRYPEQQPQQLIQRLSEHYQINKQNILLSRGSDEAIDLLMRLFCLPGQDSIIVCPPTFGMYAIYAKLQGIDVKVAPLIKEGGFQLNLESVAKQWDVSVKLIFICSPNNPTGNQIDIKEILSLCETYSGKSIIVVDEAYIEFAQEQSLVETINRYDNLVLLRTLSKAYGLAGARCGITLASKGIIQYLSRLLPPYPLASPTIAVVKEVFKNENLAKIANYIHCIKQQRAQLYLVLQQMNITKQVWPSEANFILVEFTDLVKVMAQCRGQGVILREFSGNPSLKNCARITVGTPQENERLIQILTRIFHE